MQNYSEALAVLNGRVSRKLENNTYLHKKEDGSIGVRLHETDVVTYHKDGRAILNSGGWRTVTTKDRINTYAPGSGISQSKGVWYMDGGKLFFDGVTIFSDGRTNAKEETKTDKRKVSALKKRIRTYAKNYVDALFAGKVSIPSAGDCWFCVLRTEQGQTLGEASKDAGHFEAHMKDSYFVPSLLITAMERHGASIAMKQTALALMNHKPEYSFATTRENFIFQQLETVIYRHMKRGYGVA